MFERIIASVAPGWAARRAVARLTWQRLSALYDGAQTNRRTKNWRTSNAGPNAELQPALTKLRQRSRDLVRNNPFAAAGLDLTVSYQVGAGIVPRSATGDAAADGQADALFATWCAKADATGQTDFYGLQALLARSRAESGESFALMVPMSAAEMRRRGTPVPLSIQVVEADHLDESMERGAAAGALAIRQGIEIDAQGRPIAYHLRTEHPGERAATLGGLAGLGKTLRYDAAQVLHLFRADRPGQLRGMPDLAPVMMRLRSLDELEDAALEREKIQACLAAFVTSPAPAATGPLEDLDDAGDPVKSFYPGMIERLLPGEGVEFATPSGAAAFSELARHQLHAIATGWGLTYDLLTGDLSGANYSSLRAGRLAFRRRLERVQWHCLIPAMCQRVWDAFIAAAVQSGALPPRAGGYPVQWAPPVFEMVDPLKDAMAVKEQLRLGLLTWGQAVAQMGWEPRRQVAEIAEWNALHDDSGLILDGDPRRTANSGGAQNAAANAAIEIAATGAATNTAPQP